MFQVRAAICMQLLCILGLAKTLTGVFRGEFRKAVDAGSGVLRRQKCLGEALENLSKQSSGTAVLGGSLRLQEVVGERLAFGDLLSCWE